MEAPWTILELAELAAGTLAAGQPIGSDGAGTPEWPESAEAKVGRVRANGRVRDMPNERLVRWYVTVGLVDPPLSRRGRVARYGRRHLLQLVAVKRRQAEGRSLAEIQAELAGATDETLAAIARVPDAMLAPETPQGEGQSAPGRFWTRQSRQADEPAPAAAAHGDHGTAAQTAGLVHGVRLAPGVTLLIESTGREPGPDDVTEIVHAAQPLLAELASRGLFASSPDVLPDVPGRSSQVGSSPRRAGHDH